MNRGKRRTLSVEQATKDIPKVAAMLNTAKEVLGYDLLDLCLNGPKEQLDQTQYAQVWALSVENLTAQHNAL